MSKVQVYRVMKSLSEKPMAGLDDSILYVFLRNVEWRNTLIKKYYEESIKLVDQLIGLVASKWNELVYIKIKCLKDDGKTLEATKVIIESFEGNINYVKEAKCLIPNDLTTIAKIESLLFLCIWHLDNHADKVVYVHREKES